MKTPSSKLRSSKIAQTMLATGIVAVAVAAPTPFDDKAEAANVQLKDISEGSNIKFAGYDWIVLDPSTGYILMKDNLEMKAFDANATKIFDPSDSNNIGYFLNSTWFGRLPEDQRAWIQEKSWSIGNENNESASSVSAKVGLISYSEWNRYKGMLGNLSWWFWTRTPHANYPNYIWNVYWDGNLSVSVVEHHTAYPSGGVRPALYLDSRLWVSDGTVVGFTQPPVAPNVTGNDETNKITGIDASMEYQIDGGAWITYNAATPPDLSGSKTVNVRVKASGGVPAGEETTLTFTHNPPAAPNVTADDTSNTINGITTAMEYKIDGGAWITYNAGTPPVLSGSKTVEVRVKASGGVPVGEETTLTFTHNPPAAPNVTADDTSNTINGITTVMEYQIDGGAWITYNGATPPDLSGSKTVNVRMKVSGDVPAGEVKELTFTNRTPTATVMPLPDQTTNKGTNKTVDVSSNFSDADGDALTYTASSNKTSVATVGISGKTLTITPVSQGEATITVTADDEKGGKVSRNFKVTVENRTPTATVTPLPDQTTNKGTNKTVDVSSNFSDADGDALTYTVSSAKTSVATVSMSGKTLTITPVSQGEATITVTADDEKGGKVSRNFKVTVENRTPTGTITPLPDQTTNKGTNKTVDVSSNFSDADGDALTYTASSAKTSVATVSMSGKTLTITPVSQGEATITVTADDEKGGKVSRNFKVTVENRTPTATVTPLPDQTTNKGTNKTVDMSTYFSDGDDDPLTYTASSSSDVATVHVSGNTLTITPVSRGEATITVTADDEKGGTVSRSFKVTVENRKPMVKTLPEQTMNKESNPAVVDMSAYFSDGDDDLLTYTASLSSDVATVHVSGDTVTITPVSQGTGDVTVTANDGKGGTVSESFKVTIANRKPTASTIPNQTMERGSKQTVNLSTYFSDVDDDSLTYSAVSSEDVATVQVTGDTLTITSAVQGNDTLMVTANDGKGGTITESFTVTFVIPIPAAPNVTANDTTNKIQSATNTMEYSTDNGTTWTTYDVSNEPAFTGNKTVLVRVKANGDIPFGDSTTLTFTTNPSSGGGYSDGGSTSSPIPTPDSTPVPDPTPVVQAPKHIKTVIKDGKLQIQVKDEKTGEWKPARIEHTQSFGGYFIIQIGSLGEDVESIEIPRDETKIVVLDNDQPYAYFDLVMETASTKEWKVKFSAPLLNEIANFENIIVWDAEGNNIDIQVTLSEDGQTVVITPDQPYKKGELYYMTITDTIGENGKKQKKPIRKIFIVE